MKKAFNHLALLAIVLLMSSFTSLNVHQFIGTYGVSVNDPSQIILTINSDQTFYYQDFSVIEKKIVVKGSWLLKGNKVVLKENDTTKKFHNVWTFDKNGRVAKSRIGLTFYKLHKKE
jgi:hypothetical protein